MKQKQEYTFITLVLIQEYTGAYVHYVCLPLLGSLLIQTQSGREQRVRGIGHLKLQAVLRVVEGRGYEDASPLAR